MADWDPGRWAAPLHARALDAAGALGGRTLLDLGCGSGAFARAAVDRGATVTGIDTDRSAVAAAAAAVPQAAFAVGDAHDPPPGPFDVAAGIQLLEHVRNPLRVLRAGARVAGTVIVTVWGAERECDVRAFSEALAPWLPPRRSPAGPPPVTDPQRLRKLARLAELRVEALDEVDCPFDYPGTEALLGPLLASSMGRHALRRAGERQIRAAVLARLAAHRTPDGGYRLHNVVRVLAARPARG